MVMLKLSPAILGSPISIMYSKHFNSISLMYTKHTITIMEDIITSCKYSAT